MTAPLVIQTARLLLRKPKLTDAAAVYQRYAGYFEVTRYVGWRRHHSIDDSRAFLELSDAEWDRWPAGPYLICDRQSGVLLGGTGLAYEQPDCAVTGYVLARDSWGQGYATEALQAIVQLAEGLSVRRLYAVCHPDHTASRRVLEKCVFETEGTLPDYCEFPNLKPNVLADVLCYSRYFS